MPDPQATLVSSIIVPTPGFNAQPVNTFSALGCVPFLSAVRYISETCASIDVKVEGAEDHPWERTLNLEIGPNRNAYTGKQVWIEHAAATGNGYMRKFQKYGQTWLKNLPPNNVKPVEFENELFYEIKGEELPVEASEILHLRGFSHDGITGLNPAEILQPTFQLSFLIDLYTRRYLQKGGAHRGYLEFDKTITEKQVESAIAQWQGFGQTDDAVGRTPVLRGGKYVTINASNQDAQLIEQKREIRTDIAAALRVPPQSLFQFEKYVATGGAQTADAINGVRIWIEQIETELTLKLLTSRELDAGLRIKLDTDALTRIPTTPIAPAAATPDAQEI